MDTIISRSPEDTSAAAGKLAEQLKAGDVVGLDGDLGAGKTQFVKGLAEALGFKGTVTSPTFTLVHEYIGGRLPVFHFDFYRLENEKDLQRVGLDDYFECNGVMVIEWASRFAGYLPAHTRWFQFRALPNGERSIERCGNP